MDYEAAQVASLVDGIEQQLQQVVIEPEGEKRTKMETRVRQMALRYHCLTGRYYQRKWAGTEEQKR